ncbi:MFS-type transporter SLC18B1 [Eumeta japonica]|uniref:MFS-type transporter SLC18B1 n=1 Tax=Eumeta variegata TaxID=151549 RepID=A0A4C2A2D9_EUMVA|nr:MFS-type transporter SLC18B1 [Eumeta japonica]
MNSFISYMALLRNQDADRYPIRDFSPGPALVVDFFYSRFDWFAPDSFDPDENCYDVGIHDTVIRTRHLYSSRVEMYNLNSLITFERWYPSRTMFPNDTGFESRLRAIRLTSTIRSCPGCQAEKKQCTATEYGLVFGIFELVVFLVSPLYGAHLNKLGPKLLFNAGILTTGTCAILFGLLDKVDGHLPFISLSFAIRIVEAMGNAAFLTASFAIIAKEFPNNVATMFASLETFFGLGLIVGPTLGGALYNLGGYSMPFGVLGAALFCAAVMSCFSLPRQTDEEDVRPTGPTMLTLLRIPGVLLAALSIISTSMSIGFLQATLEPHLRQFRLSPVVLGLMFVINGGVYALSAPLWGWLCDRPHLRPKAVTVVGCLFVAGGFLLIGPTPFLGIPVSVTDN